MTLITRQVKGSRLSIQEMDDNLLYLESLGGSSGSNSTVTFTKDATITEAHIGRLAMVKPTTFSYDYILVYVIGVIMSEGEFSVGDVISDGNGNTAEILDLEYDAEEEGWGMFLKPLNGEIQEDATITNGQGAEGEVALVFAPIYTPQVGNVFALVKQDPDAIDPEDDTILLAQCLVDSVDGNTVYFTIISQSGDIEEAELVFYFDQNDFDFLGATLFENLNLGEETSSIATLCQTTEGVVGDKLQFGIEIEPIFNKIDFETKLIKIEFNGDNIQDGQQLLVDWGYGSKNFVFRDSPSNEEIQIGATLSDTLDNLEDFITENSSTWHQDYYRYIDVYERDGSNSITLEMLGGFKHHSYTFDDGGRIAAYHIDSSLSGDLGDDNLGGYAVITTERGLSHPNEASDISALFENNEINQAFFTLNTSNPFNQFFLFSFYDLYIEPDLNKNEMGFVVYETNEVFLDKVKELVTEYFSITAEDLSGSRVTLFLEFNGTFSNNSWSTTEFAYRNLGYFYSEIQQNPTLSTPTMVRSLVLGQIAEVEENTVLISNQPIVELELATNEEAGGNNDVLFTNGLPQNPLVGDWLTSYITYVVAWNDGKVVSWAIPYTAQFSSTLLETVLAHNLVLASFTPLEVGKAGDKIKCNRGAAIFGN